VGYLRATSSFAVRSCHMKFNRVLAASLIVFAPTSAVAQTSPCASFNDATNNVTTLITGRYSTPATWAYLYKPTTTVTVRSVRILTRNKYTTSFMKLELFSHDSATGHPAARLAGGTWWCPASLAMNWQGTNFDRDVTLQQGSYYWLAWTETGWATPPFEDGTGVVTRMVRRLGPTAAWSNGPDAAAKMRFFCELLDDKDVALVGPACKGANGDRGSLFTNTLPVVPNPDFIVQGTGFPPNALTFLVIGFNPTFTPIPLGSLAPGCYLNSDQFLLLTGQTGCCDIRSATAYGHVYFPIPIPADPKLKGFAVNWQMAAADVASSNPLPLVFTNGLRTTLN